MLEKYFSSYGQHNISQDGFGLFGELINQTAFYIGWLLKKMIVEKVLD